jgi:iron uptake system component EfeO
MKSPFAALVCAVLFAGCSSSSDGGETDAQRRAALPQQMHDSLQSDLRALVTAATALRDAAPTTAAAWSGGATVDTLRASWRDARVAYEHVEGALAPIFPELDASLDARYDDFLAMLNGAGDADLFDGQGVTGMHAIERILYADRIPARVVDFEKTLPGYAPAAFPATDAQAASFKTKLVQRLIDDAQALEAEWQPAAIDVGVAFQGLVALMNEQREKVNKAATGEEESRYAQMTLFDLRNNLDGTSKIYALFQPWLASKGSDGHACDGAIEAGFGALHDVYARYDGDAVPTPPATWSSDAPTASDLASPFGTLWSTVQTAVDPTKSASVVSGMNDAARILGFPQFVEGS